LFGLFVPPEHGCFVKVPEDASIEVKGILPTPTMALDVKLSVPPARAS
jgi:hypothetical protein